MQSYLHDVAHKNNTSACQNIDPSTFNFEHVSMSSGVVNEMRVKQHVVGFTALNVCCSNSISRPKYRGTQSFLLVLNTGARLQAEVMVLG
jgi:hypothetical protein